MKLSQQLPTSLMLLQELFVQTGQNTSNWSKHVALVVVQFWIGKPGTHMVELQQVLGGGGGGGGQSGHGPHTQHGSSTLMQHGVPHTKSQCGKQGAGGGGGAGQSDMLHCGQCPPVF
jgi:hypothetical protein